MDAWRRVAWLGLRSGEVADRGSTWVLFRGSDQESATLAHLFLDRIGTELPELACELRVMEDGRSSSTWVVVAHATDEPGVEHLVESSLRSFNAKVEASADLLPLQDVERFLRRRAKKSAPRPSSGAKRIPGRPPAAPSADWTATRVLDEPAVEARLGDLRLGDCVTLSGRHASAGERLLHIHGLASRGVLVQWQSLQEAEYEFFLVGSRSRRGGVQMQHENGESDEMPARFAATVDQASIAVRAFIESGDRAPSLEWEFAEVVSS